MPEHLQQLLSDWTVIISHPKIIIPLIGGVGIGLLVCKSPWVSRLRRKSDREFWVYGADGVAAAGLFIATQYDQPIMPMLSMLILVFGSAIAIPWLYFNIYRGKK